MNRWDILLFLAITGVSLWTIHGQQQERRLFIDWQQAKDQQISLQTEGDQWQLEKGTLSASSRIEVHASGLGMIVPSPDQKRWVVGTNLAEDKR